jgi:hypothetical protein
VRASWIARVGQKHRGGRRTARLRRRQEGKGHSKRHILVDTEGFVLKAKLHSAKVMDFEKGSRRCCMGQIRYFLASVICGWMVATAQRRRVPTG